MVRGRSLIESVSACGSRTNSLFFSEWHRPMATFGNAGGEPVSLICFKINPTIKQITEPFSTCCRPTQRRPKRNFRLTVLGARPIMVDDAAGFRCGRANWRWTAGHRSVFWAVICRWTLQPKLCSRTRSHRAPTLSQRPDWSRQLRVAIDTHRPPLRRP